MKQDSRKVRRFAVQLPSTFLDQTRNERGTVLNLSPQGCAMMAERVPAISTHISMQIDLVNGEMPVDIELAGVRWVSERRCGLEFIRIAPEALARLRSFVELLETTP